MEVFLVGGAVRDELLGGHPRDKDFIVIGTSEEELLHMGFQKVGKQFPVFLHPQTREEYALSSSLKEDLMRRDLTINALAKSEDEKVIDFFGGIQDIKNKILRHVSESFSDDPLRVFRVAKFASRYPDFSIAPKTLGLMRDLVQSAEFKLIPPERVFNELRGALMTTKPSIFFNVLKQVDGLRYFFPEIHRLIGVPQRKEYHPEGDCFIHTMLVLDKSAELSADLVVRYSALVHDLGKGVTPKSILPRHVGHENAGVPLVRQMGERLKIPSYWTETAMVVTKHHLKVHRIKEMRPNSIVRLFYEMDSFRKPKLVSILAQVCEADELGKMKGEPKEGKFLEACFSIVKEVSAQTVKNEVQGKKLGEAIRAERVRRLKGFIFGNDFATPSFMK